MTDLYKKPTDKRQYLHFDSHHLKMQKRSIPFGQFTRLKRICSDNHDFLKHAHEMSVDFEKRIYPAELVANAFSKSCLLNRQSTLVHNHSKERNDDDVFATTYHKSLINSKSILRRHLNILHADEKLKVVFPTAPAVAFRRSHNIRNILVSNQLSEHEPGCAPCNKKRCQTCKFILPCSRVKGNTSDYSFRNGRPLHCNSFNVCYLSTCFKCKVDYMGKHLIRCVKVSMGTSLI